MPLIIPAVVILGIVAALVLVGPDAFSAESEAVVNAVGGLALAPPLQTSPVPAGTRISQGFSDTHHALDFAVPQGTPLLGCADGIVITANRNPSGDSGNFVIIRGLGPWSQIAWGYAHLSVVDVNVGDIVKANDVIGLSGNTGLSTGPHCHFTVLNSDLHFLDPRPFLLLTETST